MLFVLASAISISMPSESPLITLTTRPTASSGSPKAAGMKTKSNDKTNKVNHRIMTILSPLELPAVRATRLAITSAVITDHPAASKFIIIPVDMVIIYLILIL